MCSYLIAHTSYLFLIDEQCRRIEAVKEAGLQAGVPIVINARTDVFMQNTPGNQLEQADARGGAYRQAGADCLYPIFLSGYDRIAELVASVKMPVNVNLSPKTSDLQQLVDAEVSRVSVGPGLLKIVLQKMKSIAEGLQWNDTSAFFADEPLSAEFMGKLIR